MKHKIGFNALSRNNAERKALKRNMVTSLFRFERIETTKAKAKEVQRLAEKMITPARPWMRRSKTPPDLPKGRRACGMI